MALALKNLWKNVENFHLLIKLKILKNFFALYLVPKHCRITKYLKIEDLTFSFQMEIYEYYIGLFEKLFPFSCRAFMWRNIWTFFAITQFLYSIYYPIYEIYICGWKGCGFFLTFHGTALNERIACELLSAGAHRGVTDDVAFGVGATRARAWISALLIDAGLFTWALAVTNALGTASWWDTDEFRIAGAGRLIIKDATLGIGSAGWGLARIFREFWISDWKQMKKSW